MSEQNRYGQLIKFINIEIQKKINSQLVSLPDNPPHPTGPQMEIMSFLYENEDKHIYQRDLENVLNLSKPTINGLVKRLRNANMINLLPSTNDKRYKEIVISNMAKHQMKKDKAKFDQYIVTIENQLTSGMTEKEKNTFHFLLTKALHNIKK
ncbi:MarR family winged helix-turn-helix transcriptional regulator [Leuconostoc gasicomitatum]|uniref:MarR family winged helix-turn-helix transcriptional regulator n=1 Tax=Leuconostoc gasicomitatum TaxID=115778 RepID=UPI001CC4213E|nr:MarR family winged helix-turn-helix transcriptional regulator [Leuconostoc gasicomitatum]MBZ5997292.1 winged helix-turn-helix transcriptional regulator [Leuconostoc gasicomitatum]